MRFKYLTVAIQKKIQEYVENLEVDVSELDSYKYTSSYWDHVNNPEPSEEDWNEAEELMAKYELFKSYIDSGNIDSPIDNYIDVAPDLKLIGVDAKIDENKYFEVVEELTKEAVEYCQYCIDYIQERL